VNVTKCQPALPAIVLAASLFSAAGRTVHRNNPSTSDGLLIGRKLEPFSVNWFPADHSRSLGTTTCRISLPIKFFLRSTRRRCFAGLKAPFGLGMIADKNAA
jgi:hypothetical protein